MLESGPDTRITTAGLARAVGVSEAALYRHFPSKTKMFDALIEFVEEALFTRIKRITEDEQSGTECCNRILMLLLGFCERNPGITRILLPKRNEPDLEEVPEEVRESLEICLVSHVDEVLNLVAAFDPTSAPVAAE